MQMNDSITGIASRLPKVHIERNFLDPTDHAALLADTLASEADYAPSLVAKYRHGELERGIVNEGTRRSGRRSLGESFRTVFKSRVCERQDAICTAIGISFPDPPAFEIEAVHSGDGAFFHRHIDTALGPAARFRVISAIYYYNAEPRRFSGGALRVFSIDQTQAVTIEPEDNTMVFFPSIFIHEVLPVSVPSHAFEAGRFSVNCWINQAR